MQLDEIVAFSADQDRGREFELVHPVDGTPTGIRLRIAGPDSAVQHRAQLRLADDMAELARPDGTVPAATRERLRIACLAACVLGWEIHEGGQPIPFSHQNVERLLRSGRWVQEQVDALASDPAAFREAH